jgi:hypothetical protein
MPLWVRAGVGEVRQERNGVDDIDDPIVPGHVEALARRLASSCGFGNLVASQRRGPCIASVNHTTGG